MCLPKPTQPTSTPEYRVDFGVDVSQCTYTATPGTSVDDSVANRISTVAPATLAANEVYVFTQQTDGLHAAADASLHLTVVCPPA